MDHRVVPPVVPPEGSSPPLPSRRRRFSAAVATLKQQDLSSYTCTFSPRCVISVYFSVALIFIPIGAALVAGNSTIRSTGTQVYSTPPLCRLSSSANDFCLIKFPVQRTIRAPSYLYYSLTNFYQNARKYAKSRSDVINMGMIPSAPIDVSTCEPWLYRPGTTEGSRGFNVTEFRYPCGLTAFSTFNDTFELCRDEKCQNPIELRKKGISWWTDMQHKFRPNTESSLFTEKLDRNSAAVATSANDLLQDEDFIVWMRLSAFRDFDKLYRIIDEDIPPGDYYMKIKNSFPVQSFEGTKAFKITTVKWFGGRNPFLGAAYLVVGIAALCIASLLLASHIYSPQSSRAMDPAIWMRDHLDKLNME
ncbi:unnamed protein product [Agarophyton chilense]